jgi:hypothetical protein
VILIERSGPYYRLANPEWVNPLDPRYAKEHGGRWTPKGEFGALYLNASVAVAAANARHKHRGRAIGLFDLRPEARPRLIQVSVPSRDVVDVVTSDGVAAVKLPAEYPHDVPHHMCHPIARRAYSTGVDGIGCRSAAEATAQSWVGEELAVFDRAAKDITEMRMMKFADWYPDAQPNDGLSPLIASKQT